MFYEIEMAARRVWEIYVCFGHRKLLYTRLDTVHNFLSMH